MSFEYKKYDKITNTYDSKNLNGVKMAMGIKKVRDVWSVTEKIHGANFACYVRKNNDGYDVQFASRNNLLSNDESDSFYNFRSIKERITNDVINFHDRCHDNNGDINIIYGELFGGLYDHDDVKQGQQSRVQKGVEYCPDLNFKVFDVFYIYEGGNVDQGQYLQDDDVKHICDSIKLDYIKEIFRGTLDECLEHQNDFNSEIHNDYQLPDIGENVCEGVVIKPLSPFYDMRGNRAIFKNKNNKFAEKAGQKKNKVTQNKELSPEDKKQIELANDYVTINRLNNIESKLGELVEAKQIGSFIKAFMLDVIEDVKYEDGVELDKPARIFVSKQAKELIMTKLYEV